MFKLLKKEGSQKHKSVLYYLLLETSTFDVHLPMIHVSSRWFSIM
jgi:hypothetical protein